MTFQHSIDGIECNGEDNDHSQSFPRQIDDDDGDDNDHDASMIVMMVKTVINVIVISTPGVGQMRALKHLVMEVTQGRVINK